MNLVPSAGNHFTNDGITLVILAKASEWFNNGDYLTILHTLLAFNALLN
jgi:hypothetical protein